MKSKWPLTLSEGSSDNNLTLRVGKEFRSAKSQFDLDFDLESDLYQLSLAIFTSGMTVINMWSQS